MFLTVAHAKVYESGPRCSPGSAPNTRTACRMGKATPSVKCLKARSPGRVSDPDVAKKE